MDKRNSALFDREATIRRLVDGQDVEEIVVCDVSDCQLYGWRDHEQLDDALAAKAEAAGFLPEVFQGVYWFTLVYFPLVPLGTYLVLERQTVDGPDGDADRYRAVRLAMDPAQVAWHYAIAIGLLLSIAAATIAVVAWR
jgi:hypothetical protein